MVWQRVQGLVADVLTEWLLRKMDAVVRCHDRLGSFAEATLFLPRELFKVRLVGGDSGSAVWDCDCDGKYSDDVHHGCL